MLAGPYCGMLLSDLGAEVLKIETGSGDIGRNIGMKDVGGYNLYFSSLNRSKKSISLDLTDDQDLARFRELAGTSHALITNLRPQAIKKLGLTYDALKAYNERLACVAITGFGLNGPYADLPAYDYIIQAMTGVMMLTGEPGAPPIRTGYSVVDNTGGMMGAIGLLAKLLEGRGGQVDIALHDVMLSQLNYLASHYLNSGEQPQRLPSGGHSFFVPAQIFETADGHVALFITHDNFWRTFAEEFGRRDWLDDDRFNTMHARSDNRELVVAAVGAELRRHSTKAVVKRLQPLGIVVAGVSTMAEALASDATTARGMIIDIGTPAGPLRLIGNPIKVEGQLERYAPPPSLGEHSDQLGAATSTDRLVV